MNGSWLSQFSILYPPVIKGAKLLQSSSNLEKSLYVGPDIALLFSFFFFWVGGVCPLDVAFRNVSAKRIQHNRMLKSFF